MNEMLEKIEKHFVGNFDSIILNKIFIKFKFGEYLRKILNISDYYLLNLN